MRSEGVSRYNSVLARLERQYSNNFSFIMSYAFSKSLDDTNGYAVSSGASTSYPQNSLNVPAEYGRSDFDVRSRFVVSPVYLLPFGPGQRFLNQGKVLGAIVGGFQLSGIVTDQTGTPFTVSDGTNITNTNTKVSASGLRQAQRCGRAES